MQANSKKTCFILWLLIVALFTREVDGRIRSGSRSLQESIFQAVPQEAPSITNAQVANATLNNILAAGSAGSPVPQEAPSLTGPYSMTTVPQEATPLAGSPPLATSTAITTTVPQEAPSLTGLPTLATSTSIATLVPQVNPLATGSPPLAVSTSITANVPQEAPSVSNRSASALLSSSSSSSQPTLSGQTLQNVNLTGRVASINMTDPSNNLSLNLTDRTATTGQRNGTDPSQQDIASAKLSASQSKENRTCVVMSGQLRSANISWTSGHIQQNINSRMFGKDDPQTTALTIIELMLKPLNTESGVDVFYYVQAHPKPASSDISPSNNDSTGGGRGWTGDPWDFEPTVGDITACQPFASHPFFHGTGNRFFCLVEPEIALMTTWLRNHSMWKTYTYGKSERMKEQVLAQLYGVYRGNMGCKQYAQSNKIEYKYKIRLRPDTAVVKAFPPYSHPTMDFAPRPSCLGGSILFANKIIYKSGNEDWFNIGLADAMDKLLDRYVDFVSTPFLSSSRKAWWDLEDHLVGLMNNRYHVCMRPNNEIWMVVIRKTGHTHNTWEPEPIKLDWVELST